MTVVAPGDGDLALAVIVRVVAVASWLCVWVDAAVLWVYTEAACDVAAFCSVG